MRALLTVLLLLCAEATFAAEAIAGKSRILVIEPCLEYWVPLTGGTIEPIYQRPVDLGTCPREAISAAYDGERFLINYGGLTAAFFAEGALTPVKTIQLDANASLSSSLMRWDGTRYVALWRRSAGRFARLAGAAITRDGVIEDQFEIASTARRAAGLAVNNRRVLALDAPGQGYPLEFPLPGSLQVTATVLDEGLTPRKSFPVGQSHETFAIGAQFGRYVDVLDASAFGDAFYVAWTDPYFEWGGRLDPDALIYGARIAADGTLLQTPRVIARKAPSQDVDLVTTGEHLLMVVKRDDDGPVNGVFIDKNGLPVGTRQLSPPRDEDMTVETIRLPDGKLALLTKARFSFTATVTPINDAPPLPRRRAVR